MKRSGEVVAVVGCLLIIIQMAVETGIAAPVPKDSNNVRGLQTGKNEDQDHPTGRLFENRGERMSEIFVDPASIVGPQFFLDPLSAIKKIKMDLLNLVFPTTSTTTSSSTTTSTASNSFTTSTSDTTTISTTSTSTTTTSRTSVPCPDVPDCTFTKETLSDAGRNRYHICEYDDCLYQRRMGEQTLVSLGDDAFETISLPFNFLTGFLTGRLRMSRATAF